MGWTWVKQIKNKYTGQVMDLVLPIGFTYTGNSGAPTTVTHEYQRYNTSHPEYADDVRAIAAQTVDPQFCGSDKVGMTYSFAGIGGGLSGSVSQRQSYRNEWTGTIKNFSGTTIDSWYQYATANYANNGSYRFDNAVSGLCAVVNDDTQQMFFGFINSVHTTDASDPWYYNWRIDLYIMDYSSNNVYSIFAKMIPGGGGEGPYQIDDYDEPIQGDASYDDSTDTVENPALPVVTANTSGFVTAFVPSIGELNALANYLISPTFGQAIAGASLLSGFKEMLLGLQLFPCTVPAETPERVYCYLPGTKLNTGCDMGRATNQFVEIDCGDLEIEEYWGNCCDYNPYTSIGIFLPFCGFYDLDTDDVMGKTLNVSYRIDIMSGACLATIKVNGSVMYQYSGTCSAQIPLNSTSFDEFFKSMIEMGVATATGGAGLIAAGSAMEVGMGRAADVSKKNAKLAGAMGIAAHDNYESAKISNQGSVIGATANAVIGSKGRYKHAGALGSSIGFLGVRKPYLIIKRPHQQIPDMYGKFHGYPCFTKATLSDLTGYTVVDDIRLNIPDATVEEIIECEKLLKEGVVL